MVETRLVRTDLPKTHVRPIQDALVELYKRNIAASKDKKKSKVAKRTDFAKAVKLSLDDSFGEHWHVLVGEKLGFACKKRNQTMGVWKLDDDMVVVWQSPGIEEVEPPAAPAAEEEEKAADGSAEPVQVRVIEPATVEEGSEVASVIAAMREELSRPADALNMQALAQDVRTRLTKDFGTIWHVAAGAEFVVEAAEDRRNHVVVSVGKARVVCFQHEQFKGGRQIDYEKVLNAVPYLLVAFLCFAFMTINTVCKEEHPDPESPYRAMLHRRFCGPGTEENLKFYGGGALVMFFMGRRTFRAGRARQAKGGGKAKAD